MEISMDVESFQLSRATAEPTPLQRVGKLTIVRMALV